MSSDRCIVGGAQRPCDVMINLRLSFKQMAKILLIEDDSSLSLQVAEALKTGGYLADIAETGADARVYFRITTYDLVIIDWELPDCTGPDICREVRAAGNDSVPILFLTARTDLKDKLHGFQSGADDYLTKPFHIPELMARVRALLRRPASIQPRQLNVRDIVLDLDKHEVSMGGKKIELYPKEFALLEFLLTHPNQLFSAEALRERIWATDSESSVETVRVTLMRLRQKISSDREKPLIVTLRNIGYRLEP
jgi:OmpR-family two-component system manganese-sensing response regulator